MLLAVDESVGEWPWQGEVGIRIGFGRVVRRDGRDKVFTSVSSLYALLF